jgi:hypothetical protein
MFRTALVLSIAISCAGVARADMAALVPMKDNSVYEESPTFSNGIGQHFFAGNNMIPSTARRAFIAFDIAGSIPANSTVDSVVLSLRMSRTSTGSQPVELRRVLVNWGEGGSIAGGNEGAGTAALAGDATWVHSFYDTTEWATPGGDLSATISATRPVAFDGFYSWRSTQMRDDVQSWLDNPAANCGWAVVGNETAPRTAKRFDSRHYELESRRPRLLVYYHPTPTGVSDRTPVIARLLAPTPNPFASSTTLRIVLDTRQGIDLTIYDATGREVQRLIAGDFHPGTYAMTWNGRYADGARASSGVYFVRLSSDGLTRATQRLVLIR